jgi:poly(3-hydroxybutyrate) depolymerase
MTHQLHRFALLAAAALVAGLLAAPAAQAFTFERNASGDSGAALNYSDPMDAIGTNAQGNASHFDGQGTYQSGGLTVQMHQFNGSGSFDQRYNPSNLLDPFAREGR